MTSRDPIPGDVWQKASTALLSILVLLCSACASVQSTKSGEIGLERRQYFKDGVREEMVKHAIKAYDQTLLRTLSVLALNPDAEMTRRVVNIGNRLIPQVKHFRPDAEDWIWEVNVTDDPDTVNAFCMAGGKIMVYSGLIQQTNDDELAAVIGHEIAHALRDHTAEKISTRARNNSVTSVFTSILGVGLAVTTGVNLTKTLNSAGQMGAEALANLPNSREAENEADLIGLELSARAGFDPRGAANFWHRMIEAQKKSGEESASHSMWSTHPSDESRFKSLSAMESRLQPLYVAALEQNRAVQLATMEPPAATVKTSTSAAKSAPPQSSAAVADKSRKKVAPRASKKEQK